MLMLPLLPRLPMLLPQLPMLSTLKSPLLPTLRSPTPLLIKPLSICKQRLCVPQNLFELVHCSEDSIFPYVLYKFSHCIPSTLFRGRLCSTFAGDTQNKHSNMCVNQLAFTCIILCNKIYMCEYRFIKLKRD